MSDRYRTAAPTCHDKPMGWSEELCQWRCECGAVITDHEAAAKFLGPFAPRRAGWDLKPIPGFVQTGPNSYERIVEPDAKEIWRDGLRAARSLAKKGEW